MNISGKSGEIQTLWEKNLSEGMNRDRTEMPFLANCDIFSLRT